MSDLITGDFDYGSVDEDTAEKLEYYAKSGKALYRKHQIQFIADMGKLLSEARDVLSSHKTGTFIKWATAEFDISKDTVYRYVNAWDRILSQNATTYLHWSKTAVYLASSEELPKPVLKKLAAMAATDMVRQSDVKRVIDASKPKPEPVTKPDAKPASSQATQPEDDVPFGTPDEPDEPEKPERTQAEQAKLNRQLAQSLIDKAVRAVDDLHAVKHNFTKREAAVRMLQGVELW